SASEAAIKKAVERYPGRFTLWHVKDMDTRGEIIDVGDGVIDFASLFDRDDSGVRYAFVEHDNPPDPETTIRRSRLALAQMLNRA
ncbi:MAG: hypothetical protein OXJ56_17030, partial [Rhodospirillaceae bacterium]|nr:hypothetical protein [Rhodospirillaceae bacterium]